MRQKRFVPFEISGMDSLGQGVSKLSEKVTFIPKTTIGDKGMAEIMSEKKGVAFARARELQVKSALRVPAPCIHFDQCPSCHYQHVSYENELRFKKESFERLFRKLPLPNVEVIAAPERFYYRNRIQLHYSLKSKLIGMKDPETFEITPIPDCMIAVPEILTLLKKFYQNNHWLELAPPSPTEGHVEFYWIRNELKVSWNRPYAEGGFTQVYELMNQKLKDILTERMNQDQVTNLLDLFGGNGNLSEKIVVKKRLCVDIYKETPGPDFINQDMYSSDALARIGKEVSSRNLVIDHLIVDPPRSGFKEFALALSKWKPTFAAYISCDPHTLARDLATVEGYNISRAFLIDFFPSTFHFETMIFLERKS